MSSLIIQFTNIYISMFHKIKLIRIKVYSKYIKLLQKAFGVLVGTFIVYNNTIKHYKTFDV